MWFVKKQIPFDLEMFVIGCASSFIVGLGIVSVQIAINIGPAGPVIGLTALASPTLVVALAIIEHKMLPFL